MKVKLPGREGNGGSPSVHRVVVTGLGAVTALGTDVQSTWNGLVAGRSGVGPLTRFDPGDLPEKVRLAAEVKDFEVDPVLEHKEAKRMDRFIQFALVAADEALRSAGLDGLGPVPDPDETGVIVGSGIGGIGTILDTADLVERRGTGRVSPFFIPASIINLAAGQLAMRVGARGPNYATNSACATSNHAIGDAFHIIRRGDASMMIAGGSEAAINKLSFAGYHAAGALVTQYDTPEEASRPFDSRRNGFVHGEGAGILILESLESAEERGATILAEVCGIGLSADAHHITAPPEDGGGARLAMTRALRSAGMDAGEIDYINAHGTSTPIGDLVETRAIRDVLGARADEIPVSSIKSMLGHALGASAAIEAVSSVLTLRTGIVPPTINLTDPDPRCDLDYVAEGAREVEVRTLMSNSFGFGGSNTSLILRAWEE